MSSHPGRTRLAEVARLVRQAEAAEAAGRAQEAASLLEEVVRLDPGDKRALHRLGDLYGIRLKRLPEAARCYAAEAKAEERDDFKARALALWRLVVRCDPGRLEAHERIGALLLAAGRLADARSHYDSTAQRMHAAGRPQEAAVLRAHLASIADFGAPLPEKPKGGGTDVGRGGALQGHGARERPAAPVADESAVDLAADRLQNGRLFHHYGLHSQARVQLEGLLASFPEHVEGRRLLVEVCRALDDADAAAEHMRVVTRLLCERGVAPVPDSPAGPGEELAIEEWVGMEDAAPADPMAELAEAIREDVVRTGEEPADPMTELMGEIREDVERVVDALDRKAGKQQ